jgi:D-glycerate 3-kinase
MSAPINIDKLVSHYGLPDHYRHIVEKAVLPLADWLVSLASNGACPLVGINGSQGSGKTTLCQMLEVVIAGRCKVQCLSLDDFYLGRRERQQLSNKVHPLLSTRGVPGTHDLARLEYCLDQLQQGQEVTLPLFDKSSDDRYPPSEWRKVPPGTELILLEGWCVGASPQTQAELSEPINSLEQTEDPAGTWRQYINQQLQEGYQALFSRLDKLIYLQAPGMEQVFEWRELQESKLRLQGGSEVMSPQQVKQFVQHFERVTRQCFSLLPEKADCIIELTADHHFKRYYLR